MSRAKMVELDFFEMEKKRDARCEKPLRQRRNARGIQNVVSRIDPQLLRTVFAKGSLDGKLGENGLSPKTEGFFSPGTRYAVSAVPSPSPSGTKILASPVSVASQASRPAAENLSAKTRQVVEKPAVMAPLTIFYNGSVNVFDVSPDVAERLMKFVERGHPVTRECADAKFSAPAVGGQQLVEDLNNGGLSMPLARKQSLQRFLAKRKERLAPLSPDAAGSTQGDKKRIMRSVAVPQ